MRRIHDRAVAGAPAARLFGLPQPDWSVTPVGRSFGDPARIGRWIERFNEIAREEVERVRGTYVDIFPLMREQMGVSKDAGDKKNEPVAQPLTGATAGSQEVSETN